MDVERVGSTPPEGASEKEKKAPNAKAYREEVDRVDKAPESEFEGRRKKQRRPEDEEEQLPESAAKKRFAAPPPKFKEAPPISSEGKGKAFAAPSSENRTDLPGSSDFFNDLDPEAEEYPIVEEEKAKVTKQVKEKLKAEEKAILQEAKEKIVEEKKKLSKQEEKLLSEEKKGLGKLPQLDEKSMQAYLEKSAQEEKEKIKLAKEKAPTTSQKEKKEVKLAPKEKPLFPKKVEKEGKKAPVKEQLLAKVKTEKVQEEQKIEETKKREDKEKEQVSITWKEIPHLVLQQALVATKELSSYITNMHAAAQMEPLYRKMVGTLIHMTNQGITRTEVLLTASSMKSSAFFGSKIVIERYASAPDSFNIRLTGSPPAVTLFNENLDGLILAFKTGYEKGDFTFRVGRIYTEQEGFTKKVKRKTKDQKEKRR